MMESVENVYRLGSKGIARFKQDKNFSLVVPVSIGEFCPRVEDNCSKLGSNLYYQVEYEQK